MEENLSCYKKVDAFNINSKECSECNSCPDCSRNFLEKYAKMLKEGGLNSHP